MDSLRCTMADHETENKVIKGLCTDHSCKAEQKLLCVICQNKYHSACQRNLILDKEEILFKLQGKVKDMDMDLEGQLNRIRTLRAQFNKQFDVIGKYFDGLQAQQSSLKSKLKQFGEIQFSKKTWTDCHDLLKVDLKGRDFQISNEILQQVESALESFKPQRLSQTGFTQKSQPPLIFVYPNCQQGDRQIHISKQQSCPSGYQSIRVEQLIIFKHPQYQNLLDDNFYLHIPKQQSNLMGVSQSQLYMSFEQLSNQHTLKQKSPISLS